MNYSTYYTVTFLGTEEIPVIVAEEAYGSSLSFGKPHASGSISGTQEIPSKMDHILAPSGS